MRRQGSGIRRCQSTSPIIPQHLCCNDQRLEGARVAPRHSHRRIPSLLVYSSFIPQPPSDNSSVSFPFFSLTWSRLASPPPRAPSPISAPRLKPALITSRNHLYHRPQASHHRPSYRSTRRMRVSGVRDATRADGSSRHLAENITITAGLPLSKKMEGKQKSQECVCHFNSIYRH